MWAPDQWKVNKGKIVIRRSQFSTIAPCQRIQDSLGFWIPFHGFRIPGAGFQSFPVEFHSLVGCLSSILDSKALDSGFRIKIFADSGSYKQKFSRFRNPDTLTWGEVRCATNADCRLAHWQINIVLKCSNPNPNPNANPKRLVLGLIRVSGRVRVRALQNNAYLPVCKSAVCVCRTPPVSSRNTN